MKISVIIPTYQGAHKISHCLNALISQSHTDFEIIVAIDGSTDGTEDRVIQILKSRGNYKIVKQLNKGRAAIRNLGAKSANGDILIFLDDDMRPFPESIARHVSFHRNNVNSVLQGGQISDLKLVASDIQKYKLFLELKWEKKLIMNGINKNTPFLSAAHFSISLNDFNLMHGFNEHLSDNEDYDLAIRLLESEFPIQYDNTVGAYHDDFITMSSYIKRKREYALAQLKLHLLHPERSQSFPERSFTPRKGWKVIVYKLVSCDKLVNMVDKEHFFIMALPKKLRYKLYDTIIQGLSQYFPNKIIN